eukprot:NODE_334_length_9322_cov_0.874458.p3 type:complete len:358 gc:universal NODE_334_length_9322_cov_0.874458:3274-2201(-)
MKLDIAQRHLQTIIRNLNYQKSLYVYGGVGTGKTMMMREFYDNCNMDKQYLHFHEFMRDFHGRMHELRNSKHNRDGKLVEYITQQQPQVLCFDEFQVTDISDAMILYNILKNVWNQNKFIFFTSNRHPTELYSNGIQRESFLPCIDLIMENSIVHQLDNQIDYRKQKKLDCGYLVSNEKNESTFTKLVNILTKGRELQVKNITFMKRTLSVKCVDRVAVFDFNELCNANLGASDYLNLTKYFDIFFIKNIPEMNLDSKSQARRFITLIDALYEKHKSCILLAEKEPLHLFQASQIKLVNNTVLQDIEIDFDALESPLFTGEEELFAFKRASSRLVEMSHFDYLNSDVQSAIEQLHLK